MLAIPHPYPEDGAANWVAAAQPGRDFAIEARDRGGAVAFWRNRDKNSWCRAGLVGRGF